MNWTSLILFLLQALVGIHLFYPLFLLVVSRQKVARNVAPQGMHERDYAIVVTAYKSTAMIPNVVESILKMNYSNYMVYVVADNCDVSELSFQSPKIVVLRPAEILSSNVKSHFYAISNFIREHELLTIIDSDNLVQSDYLPNLDMYFNAGFSAVQGVRRAKNLNSQLACLDEAGDIYYRFVDRKLLFGAGSSASLAGSGMAFTVKLYKECLENLQMSGAGFDKLLQYEIISRGHRIAFAEEAIVFDEKSSKTDQLVKQRARWINTWFRFIKLGIKLQSRSIKNLDHNQFLFSMMLLRPPLFLLFIAQGICFILNGLYFGWLAILFFIVPMLSFIYVFNRSLRYFRANKKVYDSLMNYPEFFFIQLIALFKANKANQLSVATEHEQKSSIQDLNN